MKQWPHSYQIIHCWGLLSSVHLQSYLAFAFVIIRRQIVWYFNTSIVSSSYYQITKPLLPQAVQKWSVFFCYNQKSIFFVHKALNTIKITRPKRRRYFHCFVTKILPWQGKQSISLNFSYCHAIWLLRRLEWPIGA